MADNLTAMRRTRFVCISDTHNAAPNGAFKLPKGDVLIHAGDMTNQGSYKELQKTVKWIEDADFECKIIVAGNHDITLDTDFYAQYGLYFHNQDPQDSAKCQALIDDSPSILWLKHDSANIELTSPTGPQTTFKIFGSPFSPAKGMWAFGYTPEEAYVIWDKIPLDSDVVITHTPPKFHQDEAKERRAAGCEALRQALWRVRPRLAVCGHVHEGRGVERVRWDLAEANNKYKEIGADPWIDPGLRNKTLSLLDLTARSGAAIRNDGSGVAVGPRPDIITVPTVLPEVQTDGNGSTHRPKLTAKLGLSRLTNNLLAIPPETTPPATRGQGGTPPSLRCDLEALTGRLGRQETCIVNAAIMASSWPHGAGGKKFNKAIVVDIDLPARKR